MCHAAIYLITSRHQSRAAFPIHTVNVHLRMREITTMYTQTVKKLQHSLHTLRSPTIMNRELAMPDILRKILRIGQGLPLFCKIQKKSIPKSGNRFMFHPHAAALPSPPHHRMLTRIHSREYTRSHHVKIRHRPLGLIQSHHVARTSRCRSFTVIAEPVSVSGTELKISGMLSATLWTFHYKN